jgi:hypothetical protein
MHSTEPYTQKSELLQIRHHDEGSIMTHDFDFVVILSLDCLVHEGPTARQKDWHCIEMLLR